MEHLFKKCCIANSYDGTKGDIVYQSMDVVESESGSHSEKSDCECK